MSEHEWGRVDPDGTVWVRTRDGERVVGQYPGASEEAALAYFERKFDELASQVSLLQQRLHARQVSAADAQSALRRLDEAIRTANAVGDLDGLLARLATIAPIAEQRRTEVEEARRRAREEALQARQALVEEAEALAGVDADRIPWKASGDRMRELFDLWRRMQKEARLDRHTEDELWKRFSHARTSFDRKRRQYFAVLEEQRAQARGVKEQLIAQAEALSSSTDWGPTAQAYRDLLARWKAAGRVTRAEDDRLWARFRSAQDTFFGARQALTDKVDTEFRENLEAKEALLAEAETLLPVQDVGAARRSLRDIQERWEATGKVPRADLGRIEARLRRVEQAIRSAEQERWARSNPQARARARDAVAQLERVIDGLERDLRTAEDEGDPAKAEQARQALQARQEWLVQARRALADFGE